jgi:single-strand DNA-binding protein
MNKVILIGNVGNDPEIRTLESGVKVANFSLATSEKYLKRSPDGGEPEKVEVTEWHRLEAWNGLTKVIETIIKKGDRLCIEGKIKSDKWEDSEGKNRITVKIRVERIELLGNRREQVEKQEEPSTKANKKSSAKAEKPKVVFEANNEDLPF